MLYCILQKVGRFSAPPRGGFFPCKRRFTLSPDADLLEAFYSMTPMTAGYEGNRPEKITMSFTVLWGRVKE